MKYYQITETRPDSDTRWFWQEFESRYLAPEAVPLHLSIAQYNLKPKWCGNNMPEDLEHGIVSGIYEGLVYIIKFSIPEGLDLDFFETEHELYKERLEYSANHNIEIKTSIVEE